VVLPWAAGKLVQGSSVACMLGASRGGEVGLECFEGDVWGGIGNRQAGETAVAV